MKKPYGIRKFEYVQRNFCPNRARTRPERQNARVQAGPPCPMRLRELGVQFRKQVIAFVASLRPLLHVLSDIEAGHNHCEQGTAKACLHFKLRWRDDAPWGGRALRLEQLEQRLRQSRNSLATSSTGQ